MPESPVTIPAAGYPPRRPEIELVLLLSRPRIGADAEERIAALLRGPVDWEYMSRFARSQRLFPVAYDRLSRLHPESMPAQVRDEFRQSVQGISQHNLLLTGELVRILKAFAAQGLPILPFKGPSLALGLYGNLAMRPFSDLDLLVRTKDVAAAQTILIGVGYAPKLDLTPAQQAAFLHFENDRSFLLGSLGVVVELHWRFFARYVAFDLGGDALWDRLRRVELGGAAMLTLPPEEHLLVLAVHGTKHLWTLVGWVLDIAQLIEAHPEIDWRRLQSLAAGSGSRRMLHLALTLAADLFDAPLPGDLRQRIERDGMVRRLAAQIETGMLARDRGPAGELEEHRFYLGARERLRDRLAYYWLWLFTPNYKDQSFIRLPAPLTPLYYLIRPIRMGMDLLRRALRTRPRSL